MRSLILLLAISAALFTSCTSAYKTGQTPDDVYYSPERTHDEYVETRQKDDNKYQGNDEYYDDRYLRMKVHNRAMWSDLDDWYYYNRRYSYSYYSGIGYNPWTPYTAWNYYYNPYCSHVIVYNPKGPIAYNNSPRRVNLNTFNSPSAISQNRNVSYFNPKTGMSSNTPSTGSNNGRPNRLFNTNNNSNRPSNTTNTGNFLRNVFNSGSNNSSSTNTPSSNNSSSSSSSSSGSSGSSSSGSSAPVRKF